MTGDSLARPPVPPLEDLATMARTLAGDGWLPIAERTMAAVVGDRLRLQLPVSTDDALRVRWLFVQRRAALARLMDLLEAPPTFATFATFAGVDPQILKPPAWPLSPKARALWIKFAPAATPQPARS